MPISSIRKLCLAKLESTYGTDPTPVAATDAVLCVAVSPTEPLSQKAVDRKLIRPYLGAVPQLLAGAFAKIDIEVELAAFGTAGPAAPTAGIDALWQACGLARTITVDTSIAYTPVSSNFQSVTVYINQGGLLQKITGCRGTFKFSFKVENVPTVVFSLIGIYQPLSDTTLVAGDYTAYQTPVLPSSVSSSGLTIQGFSAAALQEMTFDVGNQVETRELINSTRQVILVDRTAVGTLIAEMTSIAGFDWLTAMQNGTLSAFSFTHGTVVGNKITVAGSNMQLTAPKYQETQNILHLQSNTRFVPSSAGNDDFSIVYA